MGNKLEKFKEVLREVFQLDQADLDFGIYRIMNQKRDDIEQFLDKDLLPQVSSLFAEYASESDAQLRKQLEEAVQKAKSLGVEPDTVPGVIKLKSALAGLDNNALADNVFSHLANFFRRYYDEGDFISQRRYKKDVYAIPYEGEEVKLYWANYDQYYIKTSEYFKNYAFKLPNGKKVKFVILEATSEANNNLPAAGKERRFYIINEEPIALVDGNLCINFRYDFNPAKQRDLILAGLKIVEAAFKSQSVGNTEMLTFADMFSASPTEKNKSRTLLERHLTDFTARNTFDYFIHKDLGGFLRRELDFFIKNEVLYIDDINELDEVMFHRQVATIKVMKKVGQKVIAFLEQLENFQKKLWLKKKFVYGTNYCITMDRIPKVLYPEIINNPSQITEWKRTFLIDKITNNLTQQGYTDPPTIEFLSENPYLVVDTALFDEVFKFKLLKSFTSIDFQINGLLIQSENFQATNLIINRYRDTIKSVYIDPPYNTGGDDFLYKDSFFHSSWLSFMNDRLTLSSGLMTLNAPLFISIDGNEQINLHQLIQEIFGLDSMFNTIIWQKADSPNEKDQAIATYHEYIIIATPNGKESVELFPRLKQEIFAAYPLVDSNGRKYRLRQLRKNGKAARREDRPNLFYPLTAPDGTVVLPIAPEGWEGRWVKQLSTVKKLEMDEQIQWVKRKYGWVPYYIESAPAIPEVPYSSIFDDVSQNRQGKAEFTSILGSINYETPKPSDLLERLFEISIPKEKQAIVLDYFAGSGTTGHAIINLQRRGYLDAKYILIEMGEYFNSITKPRIQRVIYSKDWKDGKPVSREGISQCFKYFSLESYEDTLNNLSLKRTKAQQETLDLNPDFKEGYMLSYMLDVESESSASLLDLEKFEDPFNYYLNITRNNETKPVKVDLVETFNYLIGLVVDSIDEIDGFRMISGKNLADEKILVLWRNLKEKTNEELNAFFGRIRVNIKDSEYDRIYVNGDNYLENMKVAEDRWKVVLIEEEFKKLMFEGCE